MKNNVNAVTPIKPLVNSIFLLTPKIGVFLLFNKVKLISSEIKDLKKTNSKTGMFGSAFTHKCINENANEEMIINFTPLYIKNK